MGQDVTSVSAHEKSLRGLPCCVSRLRPVTLHHCHGGSIKLAGWHVGIAQKQNPYLQIPLHEKYHTGIFGIDGGMGVLRWERGFGTQVKHLQWVIDQLGYNVFELAKQWEEKHRSKSLNNRRLS